MSHQPSVSMMKDLERALKGQHQAEALKTIEAHFADIRAAWEWAVEQRDRAALDQMVWGLVLFGHMKLRQDEVAELVRSAAEALAPAPGEVADPTWARLALAHTPYAPENRAEIERYRTIAEKHGDDYTAAIATLRLGQLHGWGAREWLASIPYFEDAAARFAALGDRYMEASALYRMGSAYQFAGKLEDSIAGVERALAISREIGDVYGVGARLLSLAITNFMRGQLDAAAGHWTEAQHHFAAVGAPGQTTLAFHSVMVLLSGDVARARDMAETAYPAALDCGDIDAYRLATVTLAVIAALRGDPAAGRERLAAHEMRSGAIRIFSAWAEAVIAVAARDAPAALALIRDGLGYARPMNAVAWQAMYLAPYAAVLAADGDAERAVQTLALAATQPAGAGGWLEHWPAYAALQDDLRARLGADAFAAAWEAGAALSLEAALPA